MQNYQQQEMLDQQYRHQKMRQAEQLRAGLEVQKIKYLSQTKFWDISTFLTRLQAFWKLLIKTRSKQIATQIKDEPKRKKAYSHMQ